VIPAPEAISEFDFEGSSICVYDGLPGFIPSDSVHTDDIDNHLKKCSNKQFDLLTPFRFVEDAKHLPPWQSATEKKQRSANQSWNNGNLDGQQRKSNSDMSVRL
jgi:hypothetical protein